MRGLFLRLPLLLDSVQAEQENVLRLSLKRRPDIAILAGWE